VEILFGLSIIHTERRWLVNLIDIVRRFAKYLTKSDIALRVSIIYAIAGCLWILFSDNVLALFPLSPQEYMSIQTYKGWMFVFFSASLIFWFLRSEHMRMLRATEQTNSVQIALNESNLRYRSLIEYSPDAIFVNFNDRVIYVNQACLKLFGAESPGQLLNKSPYELFSAENHQAIQKRIQQLREVSQSVGMLHERIIRLDGTLVDVEVTAASFPEQGVNSIHVVLRDITERIKAEENLRESEERYRSIFENNHAVMLLIDPVTGQIVDANPAATHFYGWTANQLREMYIFQINTLSPEEINLGMSQVATTSSSVLQFRHRLASGKVRDVEVFTGPLNLHNRKLLYSIIHDITERKQAEQALLDSEVSLKFSQRIARVGNWVWDTASNRVTWSDEMYRIFGLDPATFNGDLAGIIERSIHPDDQERVNASNRLVLTEQTPTPLEYRVVWADGSVHTVWAEAGDKTIGEDGKILKLSGIVQDITERKKAEKIQRQWADAFENCAHGIAIGLPGANQILTCNPAFARLQGFTIQEITSQPILNMYLPEDHQLVRQMMAESDRIGSASFEARMVRKDGAVYPVQMDVVSVRDENGVLLYRVATQQDITARRQAEAQIKYSLSEKETLLRELYHRTKNNMAVIIALLEMQADVSENDYLRNTFVETQNRIRSMALVHQKLYEASDLSRINLKEYILELVELLLESYNVSRNKVSLVTELQDVYVVIDVAIPCGLILNELCSNMLKYAFPDDRQGQISIKLTRANTGEITLNVADNGVGVPPGFDFRQDGRLGLQNIFIIGESQLQGQVLFENGNGLAFQLKFQDIYYEPRV
jgi:PAS domain S-box-containing protein